MEKRLAQMEATFERGADQFVQKSEYEHRRRYLNSLCTSSDLYLKWNK